MVEIIFPLLRFLNCHFNWSKVLCEQIWFTMFHSLKVCLHWAIAKANHFCDLWPSVLARLLKWVSYQFESACDILFADTIVQCEQTLTLGVIISCARSKKLCFISIWWWKQKPKWKTYNRKIIIRFPDKKEKKTGKLNEKRGTCSILSCAGYSVSSTSTRVQPHTSSSC